MECAQLLHFVKLIITVTFHLAYGLFVHVDKCSWICWE